MDASVLQAAQRVVNWHLEHSVLPSPPSPSADGPGEDELSAGHDSGQATADDGGAASARA